MADNEKKRSFAKKMSKKVMLSDFMTRAAGEEEGEGEGEGEEEEDVPEAKRQRGTSSMSVLQRLHVFSSAAGTGRAVERKKVGSRSGVRDQLIASFLSDEEEEDEEEEDEEEEPESGEEEEEEYEMMSEEEEEEEGEEEEEEGEGEEEEEEEEEEEKEEEEEEVRPDTSAYHWLFNKAGSAADSEEEEEQEQEQQGHNRRGTGAKNNGKARAPTSTTTSSSAASTVARDLSLPGGTFEAVGQLNLPQRYKNTFSSNSNSSGTSASDIASILGSALPKLWSGKAVAAAATTISSKGIKKAVSGGDGGGGGGEVITNILPAPMTAAVTKQLLPLLSTYSDIMWEGRDADTDTGYLQVCGCVCMRCVCVSRHR